MLKRILIVCFTAFHFSYGQAQHIKPSAKPNTESFATKSEEKTAPFLGEISLLNVASSFHPVLLRSGVYHGEKKNYETTAIAAEQLPAYIADEKNASHSKKAVEIPTIFDSYSGFTDSKYTPPDNTIAVNNQGMIISAMNSNYRIFSSAGKFLKLSSFFDAFKAQFPEFKSTYYDPKVIYDSGSDRFILVVLHGNTTETSRIMVLFSKTNNPQDGWNIYALDGDVLGNNLWTDYPNIAVSNNELYITGNLFSNSFAFQEPFILQINKNDGYNAGQLRYQAWNNIRDQSGNPAFTLVPVSYGIQGNYGPGVYLVSNNQNNSNSMNLYELTDDMSASNEQLTRSNISNPFSYSIPEYSSQKGSTDLLNSGDTRIKHAFFLNNTIHYVYTSLNSSGNSSVVYCRLNVENKTQDYRALGLNGINYSYPSIASLAANDKDNSVLIGFLRSSPNLYPEIRAVHCDDNFEFSTSIVIQAGKSAVNILDDDVERWGDYTGMSRKFSTTTCLFAGAYGSNQRWTTHIAEIGLKSNKVGIEKTSAKNDEKNANVYPNPAINEFSVSFSTKETEHIIIQVFDIQGKLLETLYDDTQRAGDKIFAFNSAALPKGTYMLYIKGDKNTFAVKKLVVQ